MSRKRKRAEPVEPKKPPEAPKPHDAPKDQPKPSPADEPKQPARGPGQPGGPGPFTESPEPKEKQQDAPASSENEAVKRQREKAAAEGAKLVATEPEGHLRPDLQKAQAEGAVPPPPRSRLIHPRKDDDGHVEPGALQAPVAEAGGLVPRFVDQNDRAPKGFTRFRIRSDDNYGPQPVRYVLARQGDEDAAADYYVRATGLARVMQRLGPNAPDPMLSVVRLPD